jgi:hypothetical protein
MLDLRHLMRAKRWVQNPPSAKRVKLVFGVIALALMVVALDYFGFWPEWAKAERIPRKF